MLSQLELTHDEFAELAQSARQAGIDFIATPFSIVDLEFLASIHVPAIKLASPDLVNVPLLDAAAETRLPVIASTGAAELNEIRRSVNRFRERQGGPLALLHCVSSYPTPERLANLAAIRTLSETFGCATGYSDHTRSLLIGGHAVAAGACIIEKHITLDRTRSGPDHSFALEPEQMFDYITNIRHAEILLGDGDLTPGADQFEVRSLTRQSIVASRDIRQGETFTLESLTTKRPGGGIPAAEIDRILGERALRDIPADEPLNWNDLRESQSPLPNLTLSSRGI
jgi:sialic acid synthase SpsE